MSTITYTRPGPYFAANYPDGQPGGTFVKFQRGPGGFVVAAPIGIDWADYEPQPDLVIPQPDNEAGEPQPDKIVPQDDLRIPRDPWLYYQQEHGADEQPSQADVDGYVEPELEPVEPVPVTDVEMRVREMQANRATASLKTDAIKARILQALVDGGMDESQGKGLGIAIIKDHFQALVAFEIGGGGATASQVLYADLAADHRLAPFLSIISDVLGVSGRIK